MAFNSSLTSYHYSRVRELLKGAVQVGCSVAITKERAGICIGFAEKYIPRGGFEHKHAGVYIDFATAIVKPRDGGPNERVNVADGSLGEERAEISIRIGDLPDTPFWEGDFVRIKNAHELQPPVPNVSSWCVDSINLQQGFIPHPSFNISLPSGLKRSGMCADELTLVKRGNLWKMEHGEKMEFASIEEEAKFYQSLGMSKKLTHTVHRGFVGEIAETTDIWKLTDAAMCLVRGEGDDMKLKDKKNMTYVVIKYDSGEFGKRMRAHALAKFGL